MTLYTAEFMINSMERSPSETNISLS